MTTLTRFPHHKQQNTPGTAPGRLPRRARLARLAAAVATAGLVALPGPVWAHDTLVSSNPGDGARVTQAPTEVELTYSADLLDVGTQVRVTDSQGADVTDGEPQVSGTTVTQDITPAQTEDESYTVVWRVVSSDGHPIEGTFSYDVGAGSTGEGTSPAGATATPTAESEATGETLATPDSTTTQDADGAPVWLFVVGGVVLALLVLGAVVLVRRIGGSNSDR
ncbi:copper resistance CopC family protein [Kocuria sp.]|uniref:copper resistance CopC family protein n=1 Tax=Kocuria sp. TaxID=1871328 RepID=UPI0026DEF646|nr:copper resistance CopC family protein [Kocuria sp.]MDO5618632.1 copper resistance protein CopC [Kocuria sp.]